jgi:hypothetical protein
MQPGLEKDNCGPLMDIMSELGTKVQYNSVQDITSSLASELQKIKITIADKKYSFNVTDNDDYNRNYEYGCDYIVKSFEEGFRKAFENN